MQRRFRTRHWILKALIQRILSLTPYQHFCNRFLQQHATRSLRLDQRVMETKLAQCKKHLDNYLANGGMGGRRFAALELGAGWHPIVPVGLSLCGASPMWTVDRQALLRREAVREVLAWFCELQEQGTLSGLLPGAEVKRLSNLRRVLSHADTQTPKQLLEAAGVTFLVCDASNTGLPSASIDLFVSNNTLEHIRGENLAGILAEFRRLGRPQAMMSHLIDMRDHYADFDPSITVYNFLKFSSRWWFLFNNPLHFQNRLRVSDYHRIHERAGWAIQGEESVEGPLSDFRKIQPTKDFKDYSERDLLIVESWLVSSCI